MATAYIALGSNLNNPIQQVRSAITDLSRLPDTVVTARSSLYQTAPIGYTEDEIEQVPDFINAVAEVETTLSPEDLLDAILAIEAEAGRTRPYPNAPRILDCDLLLYGKINLNSKKLTLPHPRMHLRGFVLLPLFEIAPTLFIENHGKIATLITPEITQGVQQLSLS